MMFPLKKKKKKKKKSTGGEKPKKKKPRIKRALSAYMVYVTHERPLEQKRNPGLSFGEYGKIIGARWKNLSMEERQPYIELNKKDKIRYAEELKNAPDDPGNNKVKKKPKKDPNMPKRPKTAYFCFLDEWRDRIKQEHPDVSLTDRSKLLGVKWKGLSNDEK